VSPTRDRDGDVTRFIAIANEITDRVGAEKTELDECDLSSLLAESARALAPELGSRTAFDAALCEDLPPALADPARLTALLRHLIRHAARTIDDEWGTISLTTGLVGLGEEPIGNGYLAAGLPMGPYLFAEVHDTGLTSLTEAWARLNDPFLPGCGKRGGVRFPNALQLVQELGGRIDFHHDEPFGTSIAIVLPA
jgi:nitrogen-specific signal transduction histidine kinase